MTFPDITVSEVLTRIQAAQVPQWAMWTAAVVTATLSLALIYSRIRKGRKAVILSAGGRAHEARATVAAAGPLAILGACGMVLSLYGLYGFATENMELGPLFAIPIMAIFDLAEVTCFVSLYRSASVEQAWTRPMRRTRRMAWGLVAASAAMNAAHAPGNAMAMVVFAAVPAISAKLIEFELDKQMAANAGQEDDGGPGLVRLVQLAYTHAWAGVFARLGFDAESKDGLIHQDARLRRAARQIHYLRSALTAQDELSSTVTARRKKRARKAVERRQAKAELAIDVAGIAGDTPAQLTLARNLVTRGRVADLARMDVRDPQGIMTTLEELAIVPSVKAIESGVKAAQAEARRKEAEEAADAARQAQAAAEAEAVRVREEAEEAADTARQAQAAAEAEAVRVREEAEQADRARDAADSMRLKLAAEVEQLSAQADALRTSTTASDSERRQLSTRLAELTKKAEETAQTVERRKREAEDAHAQARQAARSRSEAQTAAEAAQVTVSQLEERAEALRNEAERHEGERREHTVAIERLADERRQAEAAHREAQAKAERAREEASAAEQTRRAALVAMRHARVEMLDALTSPDAHEPPRWTSPAKMRGWELYMHKVRTDGVEPTDAELAGTDRDTSTARKWLVDFRAELARTTASALPAQADAHDRTADQTPALV
ncbi:hypothetical protein [Streptomyces sp. NPDC002913]